MLGIPRATITGAFFSPPEGEAVAVPPNDSFRSTDRFIGVAAGQAELPAVDSTPLSKLPSGRPTNTLSELELIATASESGITVPGYEVRGELKRGGMGVVFTAFQLALKREVAIKTLRLDRPFDARAAQRFLTESLITAKLQHPAVPPVFEVGRFSDDRPYLVMKLIRGEDLDDLLKKRPTLATDLPRFLVVFEQVCQAVGYAHSHGIIHRDLKPANVMVGEFGEVQVMDWGIAKSGVGHQGSEASEEPLPSTVSREQAHTEEAFATQAGTAMGTPAYMAPEQARGEWDKVDTRADVFSLGGILSEILTGQPPFVAETGQLTIILAASGNVSVAFGRLDQSGADPELIALAKRCLQSNREDRLADGKAVADAIAAYRTGVEARLRRAEADRTAAAVKAEEARLRIAAEGQAKQAAEARTHAEAQAKRAAEERADEAIHRAKAEAAKAAEARKRRRLQLWLAGVIGLLLAGGGAVGWWLDSQATQRAIEQKQADANALAETARREKAEADLKAAFAKAEAEQLLAIQKAQNERNAAIAHARVGITAALKLAAELRTLHKFRQAGESLDQAENLATTGGADDLKPAIEREKENLAFARELDSIRARKWAWISNPDGTDGHFNTAAAAPAYAAAFAAHGLDIAGADAAALAREIAHSPLKSDLLRALDDWSLDEPNAILGAKVLEVARLATPGEKLANILRDPHVRNDRAKLVALLTSSDDITASVPAALVAATLLERRNADPSQLLAIAQAKHPDDFDLTFALALWYHTRDPERAIGHYRAARAIRPEHPTVLANLGLLLGEHGEVAAAAAVLERAVRLHPNDPIAHFNFGGVLVLQNKQPAAEAEYRATIKLSPTYASAYCKLGAVLDRQNKHAEAVQMLSTAVELAPNNPVMRIHYGSALQDMGKLDDAIAQFRKAIELAPKLPRAHYALGVALEAKKDLPGAYKEYREAAHLDPKKYGDLLKKLPPEE